MPRIQSYIRNETKVSIVGAVVATAFVYCLVFGVLKPAAVRGLGGYAFDFIPQSFMTALICTVLPGMIVQKRMKSGSIDLGVNSSDVRQSVLVSGLFYSLAILVVAGGGAAGLFYLAGIEQIDWASGLAVKMVFAAVVAVIVTPLGLRNLLGAHSRLD